MKKKAVDRILVVLLACVACVGVSSCGNDSAEQSVPQEPASQSSASQAPAAQVPSPQVPASPKQSAPSMQPSPEPAAAVTPVASVTASPEVIFAELEKLGQLAQRPDVDFLASARAWAGDGLRRKLWVCCIAQRAGRTADLVALTRDARAACSSADATFGHFCAVARYFKASSAFDEAREALTQAIPLADTPKRKAEVAALWRSLQ